MGMCVCLCLCVCVRARLSLLATAQGNGRSTGPEVLCGPSGGPQCSICEALQESLTNSQPSEGTEPGLGEHLVCR